MKVFIIKHGLTMQESTEPQAFERKIIEQLGKYGVEYYLVEAVNVSKNKLKLDSESIVIIFNGGEFKLADSIKEFIQCAKNNCAKIWPVAFDREKRRPNHIISEVQSYDVWEQLRCRNLDDEYLSVVANAFARKIIANVMPTLYSEEGMIFVSHRRLDGEEITAKLCDSIIQQSKKTNVFRDVIRVEVGEEAQDVIDSAMKISDAFIFIHTEEVAESDWVQKELSYALLRNIPILWVKIDNADSTKLRVLPSAKPNLEYKSDDFVDKAKVVNIADEILDKTFELIMSRNIKVFDYLRNVSELFGDRVVEVNEKDMIYKLSVPRKNYHYPQRNIEQYIQLYGRAICDSDIDRLKEQFASDSSYDSVAMISDKIIRCEEKNGVVIEAVEDFCYNWERYLLGEKNHKNKEIIISGAFPDCDEVHKQNLTDAIVVFAKSILKNGYRLTFGSHPTFQKIFFEVAKEVCAEKSKDVLTMYISKHFERFYIEEKPFFCSQANLVEIDGFESRESSLSAMRKAMIQREEVAAVVCLGGKVRPNKSEEGIREEMCLAQEAKIPVFVVGSVGGCSANVALEMKEKNRKGINDASHELNEEFRESVDYFSLSNKMLAFLNDEKK